MLLTYYCKSAKSAARQSLLLPYPLMVIQKNLQATAEHKIGTTSRLDSCVLSNAAPYFV